ncbi:MAG TPA: hypothetical protein DGN60_05880, partial [Chloroflexi bacterium]|nr:hypothetical protein [Chloroflexota bacterium]
SDWLGCFSGPVDTPNIDMLADEGISFAKAYTPSPMCGPARACLASGRNYQNCGVNSNNFNYPLSIPTYYQTLREKGYFTAGVGKFDLHKDISPVNLDWGVDGSRLINEWGFSAGVDCEGKIDGVNSVKFHGRPMGPYLSYLQSQGVLDIYLSEHENRDAHSNAYTTALPDHLYCDNWIAECGLDLLDNVPTDRPWYMVVNFVGPHAPMDITETMRTACDNKVIPQPHNPNMSVIDNTQRARRNYAAMVENIDTLTGRFVRKVKERGEYDNTVIVYASDHGDMLGDHGKWGKGTWRDPSVRIPLIVKSPARSVSGLRSDALVSLHDLSATFLDFAGCSKLDNMDAVSMRPLLEGIRSGNREVLTSQFGDWNLVFDGRHKLITDTKKEKLLFDLENDPLEDQNIAAENSDLVTKLSRYSHIDNG